MENCCADSIQANLCFSGKLPQDRHGPDDTAVSGGESIALMKGLDLILVV